MADALVSSVVGYLNSFIQSELGSVWSCRQDLQELSSEFTAIQAVLQDADQKSQIKLNAALSGWLAKLKDAAYDVEDLLDVWKAEALRYEAQKNDGQSFLQRVCNFLSCNLNIEETVSDLGFRIKLGIEMGHRLENVRKRLEDINREKSRYSLQESTDIRMETAERKTSSLIDETEIIGRTPDKERIIPWLVSEGSHVSNEIPVISIIGLWGVGKTTLAQLIYNDDRVTRHFTKRMWVHVSDQFDVTRICKAITEAVEGRPAPDYSELDMVQIHLQNVLKGKQFLLVLDDIWNEETDNWDKLRIPLKGRRSGSRILITTRNETVLKKMGATKRHELAPLLESDSWSLFSHIAFRERNTEERAESKEIGKEITRKCDGLPLIIKRIANALRFQRTRREWELVLKSEIWDFPNDTRGPVLDLQLSYENMQPHLKRCFAFCSVFPKDHVIERETLIKLWMAQGFLPDESAEMESKGDTSAEMESKGDTYFSDLLGRSLFDAPISDCFGNVMHCKMIDIVHDFFHTVMRECYTMKMESPNDIPLHVRHVSLNCNDYSLSIPKSLLNAKELRTLLFFGLSRISVVDNDFFENFRFLRALDLSGINCSRLPKSLKKLKLLRYLNLSTTIISLLPEFICRLYLLQTLKFNECHELSKLPKEMEKLASLRHLEIKGTSKLEALPNGIGRLICLRTLSKFLVGDEIESSIEELKNLNLLQGELAIYYLGRVLNEVEAKKAELKNKKHLRLLELHFDGNYRRQLKDDEVRSIEGVFEGLQPHANLEELKIFNYTGLKFPGWMEDASFSKLANVTLRNCPGCTKLPALGTLPSLKYLTIEEMDGVEVIGPEFYRNEDSRAVTGAAAAFPKLETLVLQRMYNLVMWHGMIYAIPDPEPRNIGMPSLLELTIADCPMLREVPSFNHKLWKVNLESPGLYWMMNNYENYVEHLELKHITDNSISSVMVGFRNLKCLVIENSQDLTSLGSISLSALLQILHIGDCPRLTHLPNLRQLKIVGCPNLEEWCERYVEKDQQRAMSHIPNIWIGNKQIKRDGQIVAR